jgi:hypothetical protein
MNPLSLLIPQTSLSAFLAPLLTVLAALCLAYLLTLMACATAGRDAADRASRDDDAELDQWPTVPLRRAERAMTPPEGW